MINHFADASNTRATRAVAVPQGFLYYDGMIDRPMPDWSRSKWGVCAIVAVAAYFSAALWLKRSYVELPKPAGVAIRLERPFFELQGSDLAVSVKVPSLDHLSDSSDLTERSPFMLYENATPLGPAHAPHVDILKYGRGRFSHWNGSGFIFSSSDGTRPRSNGRTYWAVIPPPDRGGQP